MLQKLNTKIKQNSVTPLENYCIQLSYLSHNGDCKETSTFIIPVYSILHSRDQQKRFTRNEAVNINVVKVRFKRRCRNFQMKCIVT